MIAHLITGRAHNIIAHSEYTSPNPGRTVAVILFCIVGPFWLMYRLIKHLAKASGLIANALVEVIE